MYFVLHVQGETSRRTWIVCACVCEKRGDERGEGGPGEGERGGRESLRVEGSAFWSKKVEESACEWTRRKRERWKRV